MKTIELKTKARDNHGNTYDAHIEFYSGEPCLRIVTTPGCWMLKTLNAGTPCRDIMIDAGSNWACINLGDLLDEANRVAPLPQLDLNPQQAADLIEAAFGIAYRAGMRNRRKASEAALRTDRMTYRHLTGEDYDPARADKIVKAARALLA